MFNPGHVNQYTKAVYGRNLEEEREGDRQPRRVVNMEEDHRPRQVVDYPRVEIARATRGRLKIQRRMFNPAGGHLPLQIGVCRPISTKGRGYIWRYWSNRQP